MRENTLSFWVVKCLIQTPKRNSLFLYLRLPLSLSDLLSSYHYDFQTKGEWRDSILCPWKTNKMRGEMKKKMNKKTITNVNQKSKIHNTEEYSILWWRFTSNQKKKSKKCPQKYLKIKYSLCHSFLKLILLLTHCQCLISNLSQSPSQYSWWFHTFFNDPSAPYCRSFSTSPLNP